MIGSYISARTLLAKTWKSFTDNITLLLTICLVGNALATVLGFISEKVFFSTQDGTRVINQKLLDIMAGGVNFSSILLCTGLILAFVLFFVGIMLGYVYQYRLSLAVARGLIPVMSFFDSMAYAVTYFCKTFFDNVRLAFISIGILIGLMVGVAVCVIPLIFVSKQFEQLFYCNIFSKSIVLFLIIISCLYAIYMMIRLSFFIIRLVDKKESSIKESLCYSWKITQGRLATFIRISLATFVISVLFIILFVIVPLLLLRILSCGNGFMIGNCSMFLLKNVSVVLGVLFASHFYIALAKDK